MSTPEAFSACVSCHLNVTEPTTCWCCDRANTNWHLHQCPEEMQALSSCYCFDCFLAFVNTSTTTPEITITHEHSWDRYDFKNVSIDFMDE